jgi:hypothetical protein
MRARHAPGACHVVHISTSPAAVSVPWHREPLGTLEKRSAPPAAQRHAARCAGVASARAYICADTTRRGLRAEECRPLGVTKPGDYPSTAGTVQTPSCGTGANKRVTLSHLHSICYAGNRRPPSKIPKHPSDALGVCELGGELFMHTTMHIILHIRGGAPASPASRTTCRTSY